MILQELNTHITGPLKIPLLVVDTLVFILFFELGMVFVVRFREGKKKNELEILQEEAYALFILGLAFSKGLYIMGDYYADLSLRLIFYNLAYGIIIIGAYFFIFYLEKYKIFIRKYFFSKIFAVLIIIFIFIFIFANAYSRQFTIVFYFVMVFFYLVYLKKLISDVYKKREFGTYAIDLIILSIGFLITAIGYAFCSDAAASIFGFEIRLLGGIFEIIGCVFSSIFLITVPSFAEYDWQERINSIYIVHRSGKFIFKKSFQDSENFIDDSLVAGSMASVNFFLKYITKSEGVSIIEKENKIIIMQPTEFFNGIVIADENLISLQILLKKFVFKIEELYKPIMKNWKGELNIFAPLDNLAKEYFF